MQPWMWIALAVFLLVDTVVMIVVLRRVTARAGAAGLDVRAVARLAEAAHAQIGDYLRANWSGDPARLADALGGLMPVLRHVAREHGLALDDATLKQALAVSVPRHGLANAATVREALERVP